MIRMPPRAWRTVWWNIVRFLFRPCRKGADGAREKQGKCRVAAAFFGLVAWRAAD